MKAKDTKLQPWRITRGGDLPEEPVGVVTRGTPRVSARIFMALTPVDSTMGDTNTRALSSLSSISCRVVHPKKIQGDKFISRALYLSIAALLCHGLSQRSLFTWRDLAVLEVAITGVCRLTVQGRYPRKDRYFLHPGWASWKPSHDFPTT